LGTPPESGGETFNYLVESVIKVNQRTFPLPDQEGWLSMRNEWKDEVVELWSFLSLIKTITDYSGALSFA
jgi:hypothetical protein